MHQRELDFSDAARLQGHLRECGLSAVQAGLVALVFREGERIEGPEGWEPGDGEEGKEFFVYRISSRQAARMLGCNDRAIRKAATALQTLSMNSRSWQGVSHATDNGDGWFRVVEEGRGRPPLYVVDVVAARSLFTAADREAERAYQAVQNVSTEKIDARSAPGPHLVRTWSAAGPHLEGSGCGPPDVVGPHQVRTPSDETADPVRTPRARLLPPGFINKTRVYPPTPPISSQKENNARERSAVGPHSVRTRSAAGDGERMLWGREASGVDDAELVATVRAGDVALLAAMYGQAIKMRWLADSEDAWLRFLTAAHHAATARGLKRRMARLTGFCKHQGLDVSRCRQASEEWATQLVKAAHRDALSAERLCGVESRGSRVQS